MSLASKLLALVAAMSLSACAAVPFRPAGLSLSGRVIEEGTGKPIEGAHVAVYWDGQVAFASSLRCYHVETAVTDKDGRFRTSAWRDDYDPGLTFGERDVRQKAYRSGMVLYRINNLPELTLVMRPFPGTREERLKELRRLTATLGCLGDPSISIADIRASIAREAEGLVSTEAERASYVDEILFSSQFERDRALRSRGLDEKEDRK